MFCCIATEGVPRFVRRGVRQCLYSLRWHCGLHQHEFWQNCRRTSGLVEWPLRTVWPISWRDRVWEDCYSGRLLLLCVWMSPRETGSRQMCNQHGSCYDPGHQTVWWGQETECTDESRSAHRKSYLWCCRS